MLKNIITNINTIINGSGVIDRWGGYSSHNTDGTKFPFYGVSKEKDCKGNTYTFDERLKTVGYLAVGDWKTRQINSMLTWLDIPITIHLFTTVKKVEEDKYFGTAAELFSYIKANIGTYYKQNTVNFRNVAGLNSNLEYTVFDIVITVVADCDYTNVEIPQTC